MANNPTTNNIQMRITQSAANGTIMFPEETKVSDDRSNEQLEQLVHIAESMSSSLNAIATGRGIPSQLNARNYVDDNRLNRNSRNRYGSRSNWSRSTRGAQHSDRFTDLFGFGKEDFKDVKMGFLDSFEKSLIDGFLGDDFGDQVKKIFQDVADQLGVDVEDIPGQVGKMLGRNLMNGFKNTEFGKEVTDRFNAWKDKQLGKLADKGVNLAKDLMNGELGKQAGSAIGDLMGGDPTAAINLAQQGLASAGQMASKFAAGAGEAVAGLGEFIVAFPEVAAAIGVVVVAFYAIEKITEGLKTTFEGLKDMGAALAKAAKRDETSRARNIEEANKRLKADIETMAKMPFEILQKAAEEWYSVWDNNLRTISATQGYTKSDVQDLMSAYSQRLQAEGLTDYISGASITDNLAKVLQAGLSGAAAEEFAYQATKLNAAVPTQDFFNYASTYASIAANAMKAGASQSEALAEANKSLESFTSGLIYASRQLSGGFSTGLTDAASIYEQAAKIAQTSEQGNVSDIASVLLAVRGEVGAVAPDLASSITDTIYKMLTGGNSSDVVALRSLAGVNASNTEFLRAVSQNPQKVFSTLFSNLDKMFSQSPDAYMEKAEGYSELFGLSSEAFARIDFAELSSAISNMNMSDQALNENMELLLDGETTINQEQLKNREINKYMIENGLSLVLDNEAARTIQQHMWDEQLAREIQEATYAVDLQGDAMSAMNKILTGINNIINLINPLGALKKVGNLVGTIADSVTENKDLKQLLELGKVGSGNAKSMYQLTHRNVDLNVVDNLVNMMGGRSAYKISSGANQQWQGLTNPAFMHIGVRNTIGSVMSAYGGNSATLGGPKSRYNWGTAGKSAAAASSAYLSSGGGAEYSAITRTESGTSAQSASAAKAKSIIQQMLSDEYLVDKFVNKNKTYEDWAKSASRFGIKDLGQALSDAGYTQEDVEGYFQTKETERGAEEQARIREEEKVFRDNGNLFWTETFWTEYKDPFFLKLDEINTSINAFSALWVDKFSNEFMAKRWEKEFIKGWMFNDKMGWGFFTDQFSKNDGVFKKLLDEFMKYFVNHEYYSGTSGYNYKDVEAIQKKAKDKEHGDSIYALSEMLTTNLLDLTDPQMQTNALLAQILVVVSAIHSNLNTPEGITAGAEMSDTLAGMATGGWFSTVFSGMNNLGISTENNKVKSTSTSKTKKKSATTKSAKTKK